MQDFVAIDFETANGRRSSVYAPWALWLSMVAKLLISFIALFSHHPIITLTGQQRCMA